MQKVEIACNHCLTKYSADLDESWYFACVFVCSSDELFLNFMRIVFLYEGN